MFDVVKNMFSCDTKGLKLDENYWQEGGKTYFVDSLVPK